MLNSMTGFGSGKSGSKKTGYFSVDVRTVNHKYCDVSVKMPGFLYSFESLVKKQIQTRISRGKVDVFIKYIPGELATVKIMANHGLIKQYIGIFEKMRHEYNIKDPISFYDLLTLSGTIETVENTNTVKSLWKVLDSTIEKALNSLLSMRKREGAYIKNDIVNRLKHLDKIINTIEQSYKNKFTLYRDRLTEKVKQLLAKTEKESVRIESEVAILVEKTDITEELVRCKSHLLQLNKTLTDGKVIGRKLDFLLQEIQREINTIGSKSFDGEMVHSVVNAKEIAEQIREQIQNIE